MSDTHFGGSEGVLCGLSVLLVVKRSMDVHAVDCSKCLWSIVKQSVAALDVVLDRIAMLSREREAVMLAGS